MPNFGTTPLSVTTVGAGQIPTSAVFVPGSGVAGNMTAVEGIAINTDVNGFQTSAMRMGLLDGDDVTQGLKADAAVTGDTSGTLSAKIRGINKILFSVWDSTNNLFAQNLKQVGGAAIVTAASGVQKVGIVGNAGAAMDAAGQNAASPANEMLVAGQFNTTPTAITSGNISPLQLDANGNLLVNIKAGAAAGGTSATDEAAWTAGSSAFTPVGGVFNDGAAALTSGQQGTARLTSNRAVHIFPGIVLAALTAWTSVTALNNTQTIFTNSGAPAVLVQLDQTSTLTAGAVTFEVSYDGTNWVSPPANTILDPTSTTYAQIANPYTFQASTNKPFLIINNGWQQLRIRLSTAITGTGSVTPNYALLPFNPVQQALVYQGGTWNVGSSTATGLAVPANAFYLGGLAKTALPTAATDGNLTGAMLDKFGRQVVLNNAMRDLVSPITQLTLTSTVTETTLIAAVASVFLDIVSLVVVNTSATVCQVDFRDSTAGTIRATHLVPPTDERGISLPVPTPQATANNNWTVKCGTSVASIIITGSYISNK